MQALPKESFSGLRKNYNFLVFSWLILSKLLILKVHALALLNNIYPIHALH
jgi:hypothetical protein